MAGMTIGELARRTGLNVSAIRFYQRRGLLPPRQDTGGWQRYDGDTLTRLALIELAKRAGFTLDEVAILLGAVEADDSPAAAWKPMFETKLTEIGVQTQRLTTMRDLLTEALSCDCLSLDRAAIVPVAFGWATDTAETTRTDVVQAIS